MVTMISASSSTRFSNASAAEYAGLGRTQASAVEAPTTKAALTGVLLPPGT